MGVSGAPGGTGGTTTFAATPTNLVCPGGGGGPTATCANTSSIVAAQGAPGAVTTGADRGCTGQPGFCGLIFANFGPISGHGASSPFGSGGVNTSGTLGGAGAGFGSGGGGNANGVSLPNTVGPSGAPGYVEVWEYS